MFLRPTSQQHTTRGPKALHAPASALGAMSTPRRAATALPVYCSTRAQASAPFSCGKVALKRDCIGAHANTKASSYTAPGLIGTPFVRHVRLPQHPFGPTFGFSVML